jgi:hypothetical protein
LGLCLQSLLFLPRFAGLEVVANHGLFRVALLGKSVPLAIVQDIGLFLTLGFDVDEFVLIFHCLHIDVKGNDHLQRL